ncbi:MAG: hypothetical protein EOM10_17330, partial [Opitutae bacterium]|nr:hypothetical protein [Opitutae bacterium]
MKNPSDPPGFFFEAPAPHLAAASDDTPARRAFEGVAYSGDVVSDGWMPIVIDLESLRLPEPCPVLLQHDRGTR